MFRYVLFVFCFATFLSADEKQTICLNMIVKDEKDVIERCLSSVERLVDYWVIVDTGSTDGTQEIIKQHMQSKGIPGELHERPWVNFGHNRNEALELAKSKGDYLLFIDADEYILYQGDFHIPRLDQDFYHFPMRHGGYTYGKVQLIKSSLDWKWYGVLHEYIDAQDAKTSDTLSGLITVYTTEGNRSKDPQKYLKDAALLENALQSEPDNSRYVFCLAQSYHNGGLFRPALENYRKRAEMGDGEQEVFWSLLQCAIIEDYLEEPMDKVVASYYRAFDYRPSRLEPLYFLAVYYRRIGQNQLCYETTVKAESIPPSDDLHYHQAWMSLYGILLEKAIAAHSIGKYEESRDICLHLLHKRGVPQQVRETVQNHLGTVNTALLKRKLMGS